MIGRTLMNLILALGMGAAVQAAVIASGVARFIYTRRRWGTNPFVVGWLAQLLVLMAALTNAANRGEREEVREVADFLRR